MSISRRKFAAHGRLEFLTVCFTCPVLGITITGWKFIHNNMHIFCFVCGLDEIIPHCSDRALGYMYMKCNYVISVDILRLNRDPSAISSEMPKGRKWPICYD